MTAPTRAAIEAKLKELTPGPDTLGDAVRLLLEMVEANRRPVHMAHEEIQWIRDRLGPIEEWKEAFKSRLAALEKTSETSGGNLGPSTTEGAAPLRASSPGGGSEEGRAPTSSASDFGAMAKELDDIWSVHDLEQWLRANAHRLQAPCGMCGNVEGGDPPEGSRLWRCEQALAKERSMTCPTCGGDRRYVGDKRGCTCALQPPAVERNGK